jgi:hypothetical protein
LAVVAKRGSPLKKETFRSMHLLGALSALCWVAETIAWVIGLHFVSRGNLWGGLLLAAAFGCYWFYAAGLRNHTWIEFRYAHETVEDKFSKNPLLVGVLGAILGARA